MPEQKFILILVSGVDIVRPEQFPDPAAFLTCSLCLQYVAWFRLQCCFPYCGLAFLGGLCTVLYFELGIHFEYVNNTCINFRYM